MRVNMIVNRFTSGQRGVADVLWLVILRARL
jgi:hypothetical protein